jgi:hypothetical protein
MRYWDEDKADWGEVERDFADAWRPKRKWVASRSLKSVGPNAELIGGEIPDFVRRLKEQVAGEIDVAGPDLAATCLRTARSTNIGSISGRLSLAAASHTLRARGPTSPGYG